MLQTTQIGKRMEANKLARTKSLNPVLGWDYGLERAFDEFWNRPFSTLWGRDHLWPSRPLAVQMPFLDVIEEKDALVVKAEVPGLSKDDLNITLAGSTLTIEGVKKKEEKLQDKDYVYSERIFGSFRRSIELPGEVRFDRVEASFKNGVLEIHLPKTEDARQKERQIQIH